MRRSIGIFIAGLLAVLLASQTARAQMGRMEFGTPGNASVKVIDILRDDKYFFYQLDSIHTSTTLIGHVAIRQETTTIYCDSLIMYPHENYVDCYGHVHINDNDSVHIYSDYMNYQV